MTMSISGSDISSYSNSKEYDSSYEPIWWRKDKNGSVDLCVFNGGKFLRDSQLNAIHSAEITSTLIFNQIYNEKRKVNLLRYDLPKMSTKVWNSEPKLSEIVVSIPGVGNDRLQEELMRAEINLNGDYENGQRKQQKGSRNEMKGTLRRTRVKNFKSDPVFGGIGNLNPNSKKLKASFNRSYDFVEHLSRAEIDTFLGYDEEFKLKLEELGRENERPEMEEIELDGLDTKESKEKAQRIQQFFKQVVKEFEDDEWKFQ